MVAGRNASTTFLTTLRGGAPRQFSGAAMDAWEVSGSKRPRQDVNDFRAAQISSCVPLRNRIRTLPSSSHT